MATHRSAIAAHAAGWVVLLATAASARSGALGSGWPAWLTLTLGCVVFAVLAAWSARQITARFGSFDVSSSVAPVSGIGLRRLDDVDHTQGVPAPAGRRTFSWPATSEYGTTTVRPRGDAVSQ